MASCTRRGQGLPGITEGQGTETREAKRRCDVKLFLSETSLEAQMDRIRYFLLQPRVMCMVPYRMNRGRIVPAVSGFHSLTETSHGRNSVEVLRMYLSGASCLHVRRWHSRGLTIQWSRTLDWPLSLGEKWQDIPINRQMLCNAMQCNRRRKCVLSIDVKSSTAQKGSNPARNIISPSLCMQSNVVYHTPLVLSIETWKARERSSFVIRSMPLP